jgi:hypothetical protein
VAAANKAAASSSTSVEGASAGAEISMAMLSKAIDVQKQQGASIVQLLEGLGAEQGAFRARLASGS